MISFNTLFNSILLVEYVFFYIYVCLIIFSYTVLNGNVVPCFPPVCCCLAAAGGDVVDSRESGPVPVARQLLQETAWSGSPYNTYLCKSDCKQSNCLKKILQTITRA